MPGGRLIHTDSDGKSTLLRYLFDNGRSKIERIEKGDTSISFSEEVENFKALNSGKQITILEVIYLYFQELQSK